MQGRQKKERMTLRQWPFEWMRKIVYEKLPQTSLRDGPGPSKAKRHPHLQLPVAYRWGLKSLLVTFLSDDLGTSQM